MVLCTKAEEGTQLYMAYKATHTGGLNCGQSVKDNLMAYMDFNGLQMLELSPRRFQLHGTLDIHTDVFYIIWYNRSIMY